MPRFFFRSREVAGPRIKSGVTVSYTGLASIPRRAYLAVMRYFSRMNPVRAVRDLRGFLAQRQPYEMWFFVLAIVLTALILFALLKDSYAEKVYKPNIVYVQQWKLDRTDAEIRAQQAIDGPIEARRKAEQRAREEKLRAGFRKMDDAMTRLGL